MYMSVILYGAKIYIIDAKTEMFLFFVTLNTNLYIAIPDSNVIANINSLMQFTKDKLNILNIKGTYAVNGL